MTRRLGFVFGLTLLSACGVSEDEFREQFKQQVCETAMECMEDGDFTFFETQNDCELFVTLFMTAGTHGDDCDYDKKQAKECLSDLEGASCDDSVSACDDVFTGECGYWGASGYEYSYDTAQ